MGAAGGDPGLGHDVHLPHWPHPPDPSERDTWQRAGPLLAHVSDGPRGERDLHGQHSREEQ